MRHFAGLPGEKGTNFRMAARGSSKPETGRHPLRNPAVAVPPQAYGGRMPLAPYPLHAVPLGGRRSPGQAVSRVQGHGVPRREPA